MQLEIDQEAIRLMTVYGPVAADLRFLWMVSRINSELERIGDQAVNICEDLQLMASKTDAAPPEDIHRMASIVEAMVNDSLRAFFDQDVRKAHQTLASDDLVDAINDQIISELLSQQAVRNALDDPSIIGGSLALILLARSLERIADLATNICEEVVYLVKGADIRHQDRNKRSVD
jgi:phosphate transport system protein